MLIEPKLESIWESFHCPYVAFASREDDVGLLMEDLGDHLLPDVREPLRAPGHAIARSVVPAGIARRVARTTARANGRSRTLSVTVP